LHSNQPVTMGGVHPRKWLPVAVCAALALTSVAVGCGSDADGGSATGGSATSAPDRGPLKVGLLTSLSGSASLFGVPTRDAAQLAVDQINAKGGVEGRKLTLVVGDDASDPKTGNTATNKLVNSDKVDVLVGMHSSATRDAVKSIPERAGTLYLYTPAYEGGDCADDLFEFGEIPNQQLDPTIPYMMQKTGGKTWYIVGNDYVWPHDLADSAKKTIEANGGTVVGETFVPLGTSDFASVASKVKQADPDLIFAPLVGGDAVAFVKTAASFGIRAEYLTPLMEENTVAGIGAKDAKGVNTALSYFSDVPTNANQAYLAAYKEKFGAKAPPQTSLSEGVYEAINFWAKAAEKAKSTDTDKVAAALEGLSFDGPRGKVTMDPESHHVTQNMYLATAQPDATLKVVKDFGEIAPKTCGS
jgi:ABC-type branched-subunit amino acid transport system substrate-binding protein